MENEKTFGRVTIRARVTIDVVIDGRLVTADRWVMLGDTHPLTDIGADAILNIAHAKANDATLDAIRALVEAVGARK